MFKNWMHPKFHINQPDVTRVLRPAVEVGLPSGTVTPTLKIPAFVRPGGPIVRTGRPLFLTALHEGVRTMLIPDMRGLDDYRQFPSTFATRFPGVKPTPGLEVIGCGYDIFGMYAQVSSLKRRLFDVGKMSPLKQTQIGSTIYNHWPIVTIHQPSPSSRQTIVGETVIDYTQKVSASAGLKGGFLGFHAQTEFDFGQSTTRSMYKAFTNVLDTTQVFSIRLDDRDDLRNFLTDEALNAIDNTNGQWSPDRLFDEFGLYFLTGAIMGGRLNHWSSVDSFYFASQTDWRVLAEAGFLNVIGGKSDVQSSTTFATYQRYSQSETATLGGDPTKGGGSIFDQASYQCWKDSIMTMPSFVDFTSTTTKTPLTPIWNLATGERRTELEARAQPYVDNKSLAFQNENPMDCTPKVVRYIVTTVTPDVNSAGTDAGIWVVLYGVDRLGNPHETPRLKHDDGRDNHNRGATDSIQFGGQLDVGELNAIKVEHDGKGSGSAWLVGEIQVLCQENGKLYNANIDYGWLDGNSHTFKLYPR